MQYVGRVFNSCNRAVKEFYNEINASTLSGAIDIIVVEQEDKSLISSPFHVRFGKMDVLHAREKSSQTFFLKSQNVKLT
ncbi:hypothetical protein A3Q56_03368 [Intoshia linei]|uniref:Lipin N-terminal domain-containing protein n=1 Tax=Intoshia linei TaxID=1819745 RepID=A0A177B660_9BILA|nr:hypothetical protein A3Q56_03368 [Intoshia linei]